MLRHRRKLQARLPDQLAAMCSLLLLVASVTAVNLTLVARTSSQDSLPLVSDGLGAEVAELPALQGTRAGDFKISLLIFRYN